MSDNITRAIMKVCQKRFNEKPLVRMDGFSLDNLITNQELRDIISDNEKFLFVGGVKAHYDRKHIERNLNRTIIENISLK